MNFKNIILGILLIGATGQVQAGGWLTNGLVAFYPFNENVNDASGNGNNCLIVGDDLKFSSEGSRTNSLSLNMSTPFPYWHSEGTYVKAPRSINFGQDYTLSMWVNISSQVTVPFPENLICNGPDDQLGFNLRFLANWTAGGDMLYYGVGRDGEGSGFYVTLPPVRDQWWQISVVRSGNNVALYRNGSILTNGVLPAPVSTSEIYFGRHMHWITYPFTGGMDDIRIYDRAFTPADIQQLYAYESEPRNWLTNGLVAFYPLNENVNDASGNGNNGAIVGGDAKFSSDGSRANSLSLNLRTPFPYWHSQGTYVKAPRSINFGQDYTMSMWVNISSQVTVPFPEHLISNGPDDQSGLNLRFLANWTAAGDILQYGVGRDGQGSSLLVTLPPVRDQWWQISVVRSGNNVALYRNGSILTNGVLPAPVSTSEIYFGKHMHWITYPFTGGMDDIRIYDRAFTPADIQQLYAYESEPRLALIKAVIPSFSGLCVGINYQLQVSGDLNMWTNHGSPFTATNGTMLYPQCWEMDNGGKLFFRVQKIQ